MLRYIYVCCACILLAIHTCHAQTIKPGELVPDITLKNIFNDSRTTIKLSDFKGKLVILDFWSPSCISCILAFPKMDSLQQKFKNKIQILYVNQQSKDETRKFFAVRKKLHLPRGPFVTEDSLLNAMFPHNSLPASAWIDTSGKFLFTTQSYNTAKWSISDYFSGVKPNVTSTVKVKYVPSFIGEEWKPSMVYYSYITHAVRGINLDGREKINGFIQFARPYCSAVALFKEAFCERDKYDFDIPGRVELRVKNTFPYVMPDQSDSGYLYWFNHYCYNYHLLWPEERKSELYKVMQTDMQRFFGLHAEIVQKKINGLALVRISKEDKLKTKGGAPFINLYQVDVRSADPGPVRKVINEPFVELSNRLQTLSEYFFKKPFVDDTNYTGNIDFEIDGETWDRSNLPELKKHLRKYGLDLIEKPIVVPVLVISE